VSRGGRRLSRILYPRTSVRSAGNTCKVDVQLAVEQPIDSFRADWNKPRDCVGLLVGNGAIGLAAILIRNGFIERALCGGADAPLTQAILTAWTNMRVMARHSEPQTASRPFDAKRNGLVLGEGAAMVVLESRAAAERCTVKTLATLLGYGASSDAHHITTA
jgi:hypothetical protein